MKTFQHFDSLVPQKAEPEKARSAPVVGPVVRIAADTERDTVPALAQDMEIAFAPDMVPALAPDMVPALARDIAAVFARDIALAFAQDIAAVFALDIVLAPHPVRPLQIKQ